MKINTKKSNLIETAIFAMLICGIVCCGAVYLFQVNNRAVSSLRLSELDKKASRLEEEISGIKIESAKMQSIGVLEEESQKMGMLRVSSAEFANIKSNVALR